MSRPDSMKQIEQRIAAAPAGTAFITSDFLDLAEIPAINKALSRLTESKTIRRVIRGVYDRPQFSELLQEFAAPDMAQTAKAIARNFGWTIVPCGDTALNLLGLSTQVPAVWQYVSDGPYREYTIGNRVYPKRVSRVRIPPSPPVPETLDISRVSGHRAVLPCGNTV